MTNKIIKKRPTKKQKEEIALRQFVINERKLKHTSELAKHRPTNTSYYKKGKKCVLCGEKRAIDLCHILPVSLTSFLSGYENLGTDEKNFIILCKNHHYCLDNCLLTDIELEKIYQNKKEFINSVVFQLSNSKIGINPKVQNIRSYDKRIVNEFNKWIKWASNVFFIKNI